MEIKKLLMVDDDESAMADYRRVLRQSGIIVDFASSLEKAVAKINDNMKTAEKYDFILLDLMLHGNIPTELEGSYNKISKKINNQGQALGQWLWEVLNNPDYSHQFAYCYLSAIPQNYAPPEIQSNLEFGSWFSSFEEVKSNIVLNKLRLSPYMLRTSIENILKKTTDKPS